MLCAYKSGVSRTENPPKVSKLHVYEYFYVQNGSEKIILIKKRATHFSNHFRNNSLKFHEKSHFFYHLNWEPQFKSVDLHEHMKSKRNVKMCSCWNEIEFSFVGRHIVVCFRWHFFKVEIRYLCDCEPAEYKISFASAVYILFANARSVPRKTGISPHSFFLRFSTFSTFYFILLLRTQLSFMTFDCWKKVFRIFKNYLELHAWIPRINFN